MTSVPETAGPVTFVLDGGGGAEPPPPVAPDAPSATIKATTVRTVAVLLIVLLLCRCGRRGCPGRAAGLGQLGHLTNMSRHGGHCRPICTDFVQPSLIWASRRHTPPARPRVFRLEKYLLHLRFNPELFPGLSA